MSESPKIAIFINKHSGIGAKQKSLPKALERLKKPYKVYSLSKKLSLLETIQEAWNNGIDTMVAAGGDGTVSSIAAAIVKLGINAKIGVIPLGTLNHFARDMKIPLTVIGALDAINNGNFKFIDVARINDTYFLNNSGIGIYPFVVDQRKNLQKKGLGKWFAMFIAILIALKRHKHINITFEKGGKRFTRKTPFIFVGNNAYEIRAGKLGVREHLNDGVLNILIAHKTSRFGLFRLAWHALRGKIREQSDFDSIGLTKLTIASRKRKLKVSYDGEVAQFRTPIHYSILPKALRVIIP